MFQIIHNILFWLENRWDDLIFWIERLFKGYDRSAIWNLDAYIVKRNYKAIKAFVNYKLINANSVPVEFENKEAEWSEVLRKILYSFDFLYHDREDDIYNNSDTNKTIKKWQHENKKVQEGLELFGKYFKCLWD